MSNSPNYNISHIASNQNQKEVTINSAIDTLDTATSDEVALSIAAGGTITPTPSAVTSTLALKFTGQPSPDADVTIVVPSGKHLYRLHHAGSGAHNVIVKVSGGTGVTVAPGAKRLVYCNGTDVFVAENVYTNAPVAAPASSTSTGAASTWAYDSGFLYICYATNQWARIAYTSTSF